MEGLGQGAAPSPCCRQEAPTGLEGAGGASSSPLGSSSHDHKPVPVFPQPPGCTPGHTQAGWEHLHCWVSLGQAGTSTANSTSFRS